MISLLQCLGQISAVTSRCRSGDRTGSAGRLKRRLVLRCSSVKLVVSFVVV